MRVYYKRTLVLSSYKSMLKPNTLYLNTCFNYDNQNYPEELILFPYNSRASLTLKIKLFFANCYQKPSTNKCEELSDQKLQFCMNKQVLSGV